MKLLASLAVLAFLAVPAVAAETVKGTTAPPAAADTQTSAATNSAVVNKSISGTTATVTVPASSEPQQYQIDLKPFIDGLLPYIVSAVGSIIVILGGLITTWLKQKWNIDIDQAHRDAWQQAAQNAAGALIAKGAVQIGDDGKVAVKSADMAQVINTMATRVPAAIAHFGFTTDEIQHLIIAKIPQVMSGSVPPTVAPSPGK